MKQKIFMLLLMATMTFGAFAQAPQGDGNNRSSRRFNPERMAKQMVNELKLDDETSAWFKPIYIEMLDTLMDIRKEGHLDRERRDNLTDEETAAWVEASFANDMRLVVVKRSYYDRLKTRLTPKQLLAVFSQRGLEGRQRPSWQGDSNQQRGPGGWHRGGFYGGPGRF